MLISQKNEKKHALLMATTGRCVRHCSPGSTRATGSTRRNDSCSCGHCCCCCICSLAKCRATTQSFEFKKKLLSHKRRPQLGAASAMDLKSAGGHLPQAKRCWQNETRKK